ncbi:MAG: hypothetical protein WBL50_11140 [Candidatus Acidiferrum sp.]
MRKFKVGEAIKKKVGHDQIVPAGSLPEFQYVYHMKFNSLQKSMTNACHTLFCKPHHLRA